MHKQKIRVLDKAILDKLAFTLVELIVVISVLAILSTIGFISYNGYLSGVRDTNRISNIKSLSEALEIYRTKSSLPLPESNVEVKINGNKIMWQGYLGENILKTLNFNNGGIDPLDNTYYTYAITDDRKYFQLMGFLEEEGSLQLIYNKSLIVNKLYSSSIDYSTRYPTVYGKQLGIITTTLNVPIQEDSTIVLSGELNITSSTTDIFNAHFDDTNVITGIGTDLFIIAYNANCNRIKQVTGVNSDGVYTINPTSSSSFTAYCDMNTDGGGWTLVARSASGTTGNFGWNTATGSLYIDSLPYSLGDVKSDSIDFSGLMIATYSNGKSLDLAYKMDVDNNDLISNIGSSIDTANVIQINGDTTSTTDFNKWGTFTSTTGYWFSDNTTDKGLHIDGFSSNSTFSGNQGMIFVR
ncbi:MAG: fibrinogen-like YCDxxxxGGGW domain-containing protein [Candidatus Gracilibacteria bacterium]|nr:fibrinogen-like YCDxxxxGGGW domain-containing protein [Candidatus Gracilibacteria bacterium]